LKKAEPKNILEMDKEVVIGSFVYFYIWKILIGEAEDGRTD